jgi:hypothetical protein
MSINKQVLAEVKKRGKASIIDLEPMDIPRAKVKQALNNLRYSGELKSVGKIRLQAGRGSVQASIYEPTTPEEREQLRIKRKRDSYFYKTNVRNLDEKLRLLRSWIGRTYGSDRDLLLELISELEINAG